MFVVEVAIAASIVSAIGIMMAVGSGEEPQQTSRADSEAAPIDSAFDLLRHQHTVTLVGEEEEGTGIANLRGGVFGFTYTPHQESPLFRKRAFLSFEVHKLAGGERHILGFVTKQDAAELADSSRYVAVKLYPEPTEHAVTAMSIPAKRIAHARGPARDEHNALTLELAPLGEIAN